MFNLFNREKNHGSRGEELPLPNDGLPDSHRLGGLCPRCGKQSSFENIGWLPVTMGSAVIERFGKSTPDYIDRVSVLMCRHCNQGTVVIEEEYVGESPKREMTSGGLVSHRGFHWWPLPESNLSSDIPEEIAKVFSEASIALAANCPRASAVMARRTLEAITVDKGEVSGTLFQRLNNLSTSGVLLPTLAEWAKEVRLIGNKGAHFDPINEVSKEDSQQLLNFIRELLRYLYELPAELNRRRNT